MGYLYIENTIIPLYCDKFVLKEALLAHPFQILLGLNELFS